MTSFVLSLGQVDSIHSFVNDTVNNNDDWSSLIIQCVDSCADNEQATAVVEEMLNQLDVEAEADLELTVEMYIDGELVGGCDIVTAMFNSCELHDTLGVERPDRTPPEVTITDAAAEKIREAMAGHEGIGLHFGIDANVTPF